MFQLNNIR